MIITLTERAAKEVKKIIQDMNEGDKFLRVGVKGGGCAGYQYLLNLDDTTNPEKDILDEQDGIKIIVDNRSALYLQDVTVDFHEDISKRGFVFNNPQSTGRCGCGSSFTM